MKLLSVIGTRPEAIKMAPVLTALKTEPGVESLVCSTGQHDEMMTQALQPFGIAVDADLAVMRSGQGPNDIVQRVVSGLDRLLETWRPDRVVVHGDTSSALAATITACNRSIPVAHVEAGLRSFDPDRPWPEEMNRRSIDVLSDLLFAPTAQARQNLADEQAPGRALLTGNTGVDALFAVLERLSRDWRLRAEVDAHLPPPTAGRRLVLVTGHRRENLASGLAGVCTGLRRLSRRDDVEIIFTLHLNPSAERPVRQLLGACPNVRLLPPQDYLAFVRLLQRADVVVTDSGGIQEEAPALGKPVLVTRTETERPEGVESGSARLVGSSPDRIEEEVARLLQEPPRPASLRPVASPYGDGRASARIVDALMGREVQEFEPGLRGSRADGPDERRTARAGEAWIASS